jgi:uncharacterized protein (TIGR03086 family)
MNLVFVALLYDQAPPERGTDRIGGDAVGAYRESRSELIAAFGQPGVLERDFPGPLGTATGLDRLQIRLYDLLAHGWDLAQATGQPVELPEDLAEQALAFARVQLSSQSRTGRFDSARSISDDASAIDQLAAFLGRSVSTA